MLMPSVIMLSATIKFIMLVVVMLSVFMPNVVAP
jgi:hypothetical protein